LYIFSSLHYITSCPSWEGHPFWFSHPSTNFIDTHCNFLNSYVTSSFLFLNFIFSTSFSNILNPWLSSERRNFKCT
jgi:hypothetical protein